MIECLLVAYALTAVFFAVLNVAALLCYRSEDESMLVVCLAAIVCAVVWPYTAFRWARFVMENNL